MRHAIFLFALLIYVTQAHAQHADVRPSLENNRIATDGYVDAEDETIPGLRVFGYDFGEDPEDPFFAADPGIRAGEGSGLPGGSLLAFNVLSALDFDLPANLAYWDGSDADLVEPGVQVNFGAAPGGETIRLSLPPGQLDVGSSTAEQPGFAIGEVGSGGDLHRHFSSFLQGASPAAGIYLIPLELTSSVIEIADSRPLFLVYNNGLTEELHDEAIDYVQLNYAFELGDMNGDGRTDNFDIQPLEVALTHPDDYLATYPAMAESYFRRGDINHDHAFNNFDIQPLEILLTMNESAPLELTTPVPEPCGCVLVASGVVPLLLVACRRRRRRVAE